jgi:hypothetical protein
MRGKKSGGLKAGSLDINLTRKKKFVEKEKLLKVFIERK